VCHSDSDRWQHERQYRASVSRVVWSRCSLNPLRIDYAKKKGKRAVIKSQKDEAVRGDAVYKSQTIMVGSGEAPNSGTFRGIDQRMT